MFRQLRNESGMVMVMVLMAIVIMMVFSIGVISRGISQSKSAEEQVDRIKSEQLAIGAYAKYYSDMAVAGGATSRSPRRRSVCEHLQYAWVPVLQPPYRRYSGGPAAGVPRWRRRDAGAHVYQQE